MRAVSAVRAQCVWWGGAGGTGGRAGAAMEHYSSSLSFGGALFLKERRHVGGEGWKHVGGGAVGVVGAVSAWVREGCGWAAARAVGAVGAGGAGGRAGAAIKNYFLLFCEYGSMWAHLGRWVYLGRCR